MTVASGADRLGPRRRFCGAIGDPRVGTMTLELGHDNVSMEFEGPLDVIEPRRNEALVTRGSARVATDVALPDGRRRYGRCAARRRATARGAAESRPPRSRLVGQHGAPADLISGCVSDSTQATDARLAARQ